MRYLTSWAIYFVSLVAYATCPTVAITGLVLAMDDDLLGMYPDLPPMSFALSFTLLIMAVSFDNLARDLGNKNVES